jgi:hypothetical protein
MGEISILDFFLPTSDFLFLSSDFWHLTSDFCRLSPDPLAENLPSANGNQHVKTFEP